jgi:signal transduction histidine kinase
LGATHLPARRIRRGPYQATAAHAVPADRRRAPTPAEQPPFRRTIAHGVSTSAASQRSNAQRSLHDLGRAVSRRAIKLFALALVLELILVWQGGFRSWIWALTCLLTAGAAGLFLLAGQRGAQLQIAWYAAAGGCLSLLLGFVSRGLRDYDIALSPPTAGRDDSGFEGAVVFFLVMALALIRGDNVWLRRAKLGLDVAILIIVPVVASMPITERSGLSTEQERALAAATLYSASYAALVYAVLVSTRRALFVQTGSPATAVAVSVFTLACAVVLHSSRMALPSLFIWPLGQAAWLAGSSLLFLAAWRASRNDLSMADLQLERDVGEDSRLRLLPAALAGGVVAVIAVQQAGSREAPSAALFLGSSSLFWLIVSRLLVTLAENRRLVRTINTVDRGQTALRELGQVINDGLNDSLEPERIWQQICATGQDLLRADTVVLWLEDRFRAELVAKAVAGDEPKHLAGRSLSLDDRESLAVRVHRQHRPEIVINALEARKSLQRLTVMRRSQCLLAVPLRHGPRFFGVIVFSHARDPLAFKPEDMRRAEVLAGQAAVALNNATLYQQANRGYAEFSALYELARACDGVSSSEEIARELLRSLLDRIEFQQATVLLADSGILVSSRGVQVRRLESSADPVWDVAPTRLSALAGLAFRSREGRLAVIGDADFRPQLQESRIQLVEPLFLRDHVVGVVELEGANPELSSETARRLVAALARHAALAIDNLRLEEDTREVENLKKLDRLKTELLGNLSHELRTPLHAIKGYATTLLEHDRMRADERREFLNIIDSEADHLQELISNLLDMSRLEAGVLKVDPAPMQLGRVAESSAMRAQRTTNEHRVLVAWNDDPWVMVDVPRIVQVLTNLLNNAIKYSPEGGEITLSSSSCGGSLTISVRDPGVGIPPRELDKIFDRFHRVEGDLARRVSGTGLGLAICRGLVEAHGGRIWAESEAGVGSTFSFTLPICDPGVE